MDIRGALQHLTSEACEVGQAAIKVIQFGLRSFDPTQRLRKSNRKALEEEIGDFYALAELLMENNVVRCERIHDRKLEKLETYRRKYG